MLQDFKGVRKGCQQNLHMTIMSKGFHDLATDWQRWSGSFAGLFGEAPGEEDCQAQLHHPGQHQRHHTAQQNLPAAGSAWLWQIYLAASLGRQA